MSKNQGVYTALKSAVNKQTSFTIPTVIARDFFLSQRSLEINFHTIAMITELFFSAIVMIIWKPGLRTSECSSENENAAHAECHCPGDIAVRMREVLANLLL